MRAPLLGRVLLALGGIAVAVGGFFPEVKVAVARVLDPSSPHPTPDRSHWVVIRENVDMLADPDPDLDPWNYDFYRAEAAGLAWFGVAGALLLVGAAFARSRVASAVLAVAHAAVWLALAYLAYVVWSGAPEGSGGSVGLKRWGLWGAIVLVLLGAGETILLVGTLRGSRRGRWLAVDRANVLPAAFLFLVGSGLFAFLHGNPQWPAAGYAVTAFGALLALVGILLRRDAPASDGSSCPLPAPVGGSAARSDGVS